MPTYSLTSPKTGRTYRVNFSQEPEESDMEEAVDAFDAEEPAEAEPPKEKSFFGLGDTASALAEIPSELYQGVPVALRRMKLGLQDPSSYSPEDAAAFEAESQRQQVLQQEQEAREARGENTSVGDAFRGAVRSLPFSVSTMVPSIAAGATAGAAAGAVFPPAELATVPIGAIIGTAGGMLAGGTAAYRMAGQQFLDDSIRGLQDKAESEGKTLTKEELDNAYEVLLPIAENTGLWEAGPEAIGNAVTAGAGKFIFGFGKDLAADVVKRTLGKKVAAAVGSTGVEVGGEAITTMNQGDDQAKAEQFIETGSTEGAPDEYQGLEGFGKALAEVGPTTLATQALFGGVGGGVKLAQKAYDKVTGQDAQDPFNPEAPITEDDTSAEDLTLDEATALEPPAPVIPDPEEIEKRQEQERKAEATVAQQIASDATKVELANTESFETLKALNQVEVATDQEISVEESRAAEIEVANAIQAAQEQAATETQTQETKPDEESKLLQQDETGILETSGIQAADGQGQEEVIPETQAADDLDPFETPQPEPLTANVPSAPSPADTTGTQDPFEDAPTKGEEVSTQREEAIPASGGTVAPESQQEVAIKKTQHTGVWNPITKKVQKLGKSAGGTDFTKMEDANGNVYIQPDGGKSLTVHTPQGASVEIGLDTSNKPYIAVEGSRSQLGEYGGFEQGGQFFLNTEQAARTLKQKLGNDAPALLDRISKTSLTESQVGDTGGSMERDTTKPEQGEFYAVKPTPGKTPGILGGGGEYIKPDGYDEAAKIYADGMGGKVSVAELQGIDRATRVGMSPALAARHSMDSTKLHRQVSKEIKDAIDGGVFESGKPARDYYESNYVERYKTILDGYTGERIPLLASDVKDYGIKLPEGYKKQGDLYVYSTESKPQEPSTPPTQETWEQSPEFQAAEEAANRGDMDEAERIEAAWNEMNVNPVAETPAVKPKEASIIDGEIKNSALQAYKDLEGSEASNAMIMAAQGVAIGMPTRVDELYNNERRDAGSMDKQRMTDASVGLYNAYTKTRDALKKKYGNTVRLYRMQGSGEEGETFIGRKTTLNWASTAKEASQYDYGGRKLISRDVPINDIVAVNVGPRGNYEEFIVFNKDANPEIPDGYIFDDGKIIKKPAKEPTVKRAKDFQTSGNYEVETPSGTKRMFRDPETRMWMNPDVRLGVYSPIPYQFLGNTKEEAIQSLLSQESKQQPPPTIPTKEQVDEGRGAIKPPASKQPQKRGLPTSAPVDVKESPKPDTKSSEQKKLEKALEKVDADIIDAEADGDERGADGLRAAKLKIERQLEELTQPLPASTIKQGDTIRFKQEGVTLSGTYVGPVNQSGKQVYEVQVAGEPRSRRVTAQSINSSNDAQLDGTRFSRADATQQSPESKPKLIKISDSRGEANYAYGDWRIDITRQSSGDGLYRKRESWTEVVVRNISDPKFSVRKTSIPAKGIVSLIESGDIQLPVKVDERKNPLDSVKDQFGPRMSGHVNDNSFEEKVLGDAQALQRGYPEEFATISVRDSALGRLSNSGTGVRTNLWEHLGDLYHRAGSTTDYRNMRSKVENYLNQFNRYGIQTSLSDQAKNNAIYKLTKDKYGDEYSRDKFIEVEKSNEGVAAIIENERKLRFADAAFASMYERMQAFTPLQAMGRNMAIAFGLRRYSVAKQLGEAILAAIEPNNDAVVTSGFNVNGVNNLKKSDNQTRLQWENLRKIADKIETDPLNSITVFQTIAERISDEELLAPISLSRESRGSMLSRQRTTRPKTQGLERKTAERHLKKLGVPSSKVYLVDEPSFKWRGRYDPDAAIGLNLAYLNSIEELNDTLLRHEAVHDAVETDKKVKQRAIELLDALTDDELSIINEQIQGYSEAEIQDEQIVEAVRLMTSRRPDLRTKWARFVEAVSLAIKKFLGIKNLDRQVAELVAARILARGESRVLKGRMGGRDKFSGNMYSGDAKDSEYLAAVEAGDMEKAQRMVDQAAEIYESSKAPKTIMVDSEKKPLSQSTVIAFIRWERSDKRSPANPTLSRSEQGKSGGAKASLNRELSKDGITFREAAPILVNLQSSDRRTVKRDESGNVIPLSQRFQTESPGIRYSRVPTQGEPLEVLKQRQADAEASQAKFKQVFGVPDAGREYTPEDMETAKQAAKTVFNGETMPLTLESQNEWMRIFNRFKTTSPDGINAALELINSGNDMAPTALQTELGIFAERMAIEKGDTYLFKGFLNGVNDLVTMVGSITGAARSLASRRWSPLTERWGAAAKTLAEVKKNGPPDVDEVNTTAKTQANKEAADKAPKDSTIKRLLAKAKGEVTWSEFFTENPRDKQKDRQREIYIKILESDKFKDLSKDERLELTKALDKIWRQEHGRVFLREFEKKIPLKNPKLKKQLAAKAPALLKAINLGTFDSEAYRKEIAQTYGLKDMSDADLVKVIKLGAEIQGAPIESLARRKKIMQLADLVSGVTNIPRSHILASYYISSLLASARTGVGAAFSFVEVLMESFMGVIASGVKSPTQALNGLNAAIKAFPRGVLEGLSHFYTGDKTGTLLASDSFNQYLGGEGYSPVSLGSLLWKEKNPVKKFAGVVIMAAERMLTGIDLALSSTLHEASLVWANSATEFKDANGNTINIRNPTAADKQRMRDQVIAEEFGGVEPPKTLPNLAKINAGMRDQIERFYINEAPDAGMELVKTGRRVASGPSFQGEVRGAMGFVVNRVNTFFGDASEQFEKWADKKGISGVERQIYAMGVGLLSLGKSFAGMQFFSFVGRLINRNLQFVPGSALLPRVILGSDPTSYEKKIMQIKNAFGLGLIVAAISYITGDDDDEDKMFGLEGDWSSLSGDQRDAKRTAGALPSSFWYKDQDGGRQYLSFANSSLSWIFSAVANLRELKVNNPEKWEEASQASIAAGGIYEAFKSVLNTSAMGRLGELLGGGRASKPGDVGTGAEQFASKVASFGGGFVPSVIREMDFMLDPSYYEPKTLAERAVSVIPFLRRQVAESQGSLGVLGTPAQINRSPTSRVYSSGADTEAEKILARMADEGLYLPLPDDKSGKDYVSPVSGRKIPMTPAQVREYVKLTGESYQSFILREGENLITMDRDRAKDRISKAAEDIKKRAARMSMRVQE